MFYILKYMTPVVPSLGDFELAVLLSLVSLDEAYGAVIRRDVSERLDRDCSIGAVYTTLQRLEEKGVLRSWATEPTPMRGGRSRRCYALTRTGARALREARAPRERLLAELREAM